MEFIQDYNWSITVGLIVLLFAIIFFGAKFIVWYGKFQAKQANEYKRYYDKIQQVLTYEVCEANYEWIERLFDNLRNCKYKNPEMTETLYNEFKLKYEDIIRKKRVEDVI